jgi:hypothetical protein
MENALRISVMYLSVGSGHQVAAEALADALQRASPRALVRVVDPFRESIEIFPSLLETLQAASVMITPGCTTQCGGGGPPATCMTGSQTWVCSRIC